MSKPKPAGIHVPVHKLREYLNEHPEVFDLHPYRRTAKGSPHSQMVDIWARYRDIQPHIESGDFSTFGDEHESVWYPIVDQLPQVKEICAALMGYSKGKQLGGVLITKLPPGGTIAMHRDNNWHSRYYEKFYVPIQNDEHADFNFMINGNGHMAICPKPGEVWWFDNSEEHGVTNYSTRDRIAMIVCIRRHEDGSNFLD